MCDFLPAKNEFADHRHMELVPEDVFMRIVAETWLYTASVLCLVSRTMCVRARAVMVRILRACPASVHQETPYSSPHVNLRGMFFMNIAYVDGCHWVMRNTPRWLKPDLDDVLDMHMRAEYEKSGRWWLRETYDFCREKLNPRAHYVWSCFRLSCLR